MENEDDGFDVGEFYDEGIEAAGDKLQAQLDEEGSVLPEDEDKTKVDATESEEEKEQEPEPKTEQKAEEEEPSESILANLLGVKQEQRVPVEDHIKLRKRAQTAEEGNRVRDARIAELEALQQHTQTEEDKSGDDPLKELELEDGDLVRAEEVRKIVPKIVEKAVTKAVGQVSQTIEQQRAVEQAQKDSERAIKSEKEFSAQTPDYDEITSAAKEIKDFLSPEDKHTILSADNPAKKCYEICKAKRDKIRRLFGFTPATTKTSKKTTEEEPDEPEEEEVTEDDFLNVFE